jgi:hypothetical protein
MWYLQIANIPTAVDGKIITAVIGTLPPEAVLGLAEHGFGYWEDKVDAWKRLTKVALALVDYLPQTAEERPFFKMVARDVAHSRLLDILQTVKYVCESASILKATRAAQLVYGESGITERAVAAALLLFALDDTEDIGWHAFFVSALELLGKPVVEVGFKGGRFVALDCESGQCPPEDIAGIVFWWGDDEPACSAEEAIEKVNRCIRAGSCQPELGWRCP